MGKKTTSVPSQIREALKERVYEKYGDLISTLPKYGPNPMIDVEPTNDGYRGEARFYGPEGRHSSSFWEYKLADGYWHMYRDWND